MSSGKNCPFISLASLTILLVIAVAVSLAGCAGPSPTASPTPTALPSPAPSSTLQPSPVPVTEASWEKHGYIPELSGPDYCDPDIIPIDNNTYRMYFANGTRDRVVYSATSSDGVNWHWDQGSTFEACFPDVVRLPDGKLRMYYTNGPGKIRSATSADGLHWTAEKDDVIGLSDGNGGMVDNLAGPSTILLDDGTYLMVHRADLYKKYAAGVPNDKTSMLHWATSKDGINFEQHGIALDSRNSRFMGFMDGPDLVSWSDGTVRVYFWTYDGIYYSTYSNGTFTEPVFAHIDNLIPEEMNRRFPSAPPSDPTLIQIGDTWFMYYGHMPRDTHPGGVYYATLKA